MLKQREAAEEEKIFLFMNMVQVAKLTKNPVGSGVEVFCGMIDRRSCLSLEKKLVEVGTL